MGKRKKQAGFTLLELMAVTAIIGMLMSVAIPAYSRYSDRARFSEVLLFTTPYKNAIEVAAFRGMFSSLNDMDSGRNGIPPFVWPWFTGEHMRGVFNGSIIVWWKLDGSPLSGHSYILHADSHVPPITWTEGGSCFDAGYC
ncbi:MAG: prepilin-type N-terminal cleavage/methylation domain-containing protein [Pseudomonadales bacterium]|nr:prepilin-type N-terminal cleavage/methylation domain-containing protein [Pseudomonadales bacterium]